MYPYFPQVESLYGQVLSLKRLFTIFILKLSRIKRVGFNGSDTHELLVIVI